MNMSLILFAIIGATINAGTWYWVVFGTMCATKVISLIVKLIVEVVTI